MYKLIALLRSQSRSYNSSSKPPLCWKCGSNIKGTTFFCKNTTCAAIQPIKTPAPNYYDLLLPGHYKSVDQILSHGFNVPPDELKKHFFRLQRDLHPDKFGSGSNEERQLSEQQSTYINEAYHTLRNPLTRAQYLLSLKGINTADESRTISSDYDKQGFLMTVMDIQEEIENSDDLIRIQTENDARMQRTINEISNAFENGQDDIAKRKTMELKYWVTISNVLKNKIKT